MEKYYLKSSVDMIHCCRWRPENRPIGIIQIIHGVREHTARYDAMASYFSARGYLVIGADHPGHGRTASEEDRGYLTGGWKAVVNNIRRLYLKTKHEYPDIPYIMFGHSMGSFLLMTYMRVYPQGIDAAIISGTGWQSDALLRTGRALCKAATARNGDSAVSSQALRFMFGLYNKKFEPTMSAYDWICSDHHIVKSYCQDPLCKWSASVQLCYEMICAIIRNQQPKNLSQMRKETPIFFIGGQHDPVGNFGNGVLKTVKMFKAAGMQDVLVELYPNMRHECHNERNKEKVFEDIYHWLSEKTITKF